MRLTIITKQALPETYIPPAVLRSACLQNQSSLIERMKVYGMGIERLARKAGLSNRTVFKLATGCFPPINIHGEWTDAAIKIATALNTDPEHLFEDALNRIDTELVHPSTDIIPEVLFPEIHNIY
jgi:hypothetical protein